MSQEGSQAEFFYFRYQIFPREPRVIPSPNLEPFLLPLGVPRCSNGAPTDHRPGGTAAPPGTRVMAKNGKLRVVRRFSSCHHVDYVGVRLQVRQSIAGNQRIPILLLVHAPDSFFRLSIGPSPSHYQHSSMSISPLVVLPSDDLYFTLPCSS